MAKLVQVYSSNKSRANKYVKVGINDKMIKIYYNEDCITEVSEDVLIELLQIDPTLEVVNKEVAKQVRLEKDADGVKIEELNQKIASLEGNVVRLKETNEKLVLENEQLKATIAEMGGNIPIPTDTEGNVTKDDLTAMGVKDLRAAAKESGFPEEEWIELKKNDLIDYLYKKMNS